MKRTSTIWLTFLLSVAAMTAAMGWVTHHTLQLEHEERLSALRSENERLALWRMESILMPFVSSESSRDYSEWGTHEWANGDGRGEVPDAGSPGDLFFTVRFGSPFVAEYFRCDSTGRLVTGRSITPANLLSEGEEAIESAAPLLEGNSERLQKLESAGARGRLFDLTRKAREACPPLMTVRGSWLEFAPFESDQTGRENTAEAANPSGLAQTANAQPQQIASQTLVLNREQQEARNTQEFQHRMNNSVGQNLGNFVSQTAIANGLLTDNGFPIDQDGAGPMTAFWLNDELILARHTSNRSWEAVEGCILNQQAVREALLVGVGDMFPEATVEPIGPEETDSPLALASLPLRLVPGEMPVQEATEWTPMSISLAIAWGWLLLSALAIGVLLWGVVRLSERRAAFVSAVTHELRSPLTTFRLYSDLIANRESLTAEKHDAYATTLQSESERLGHLVENVLSWSRLDQTAGPQLIEDVAWEDQLQRSRPALERRAAQAGMTLEVATEGEMPASFRANPTAVDQILFNLVDNSCKYASQSDDTRIEISAGQRDRQFVIQVCDFGPGLSQEALATLFQPFSKSASAAAKTAPGVGLGLSLCRRLAASMNGELAHVPSADGGTTIELRLPA